MSLSGSAIVAEVEKFAGYPYVYGASGPSSFDCSGLVQYVLKTLGVSGVPRTSEQQWAWVKKVQAPQAGDLVFAQFPGDNASPGHVGIYVGGNRVLSAQDPAAGVGYSTLQSWAGHIVGYGQVPGSAESGPAGTGGSSGGGGGVGGIIGAITGIPGDIAGVYDSAQKLLQAAAWFVNPENWARIIAGMFGFLLAIFGLFFLAKAGM